jgi:hypothetical protein
VSLPVLKKRSVWHVGNLAAPRRKVSSSLEGSGLSVSEHPEEWTQIAKLGGQVTYELNRRDGQPGVFVNMLRLGQQRAVLEQAAADEGLLKHARRWRFVWWDDEDEATRYSLHASRVEASREAEFMDGRVEPVEMFVGTTRLGEVWRSYFTSRLDDTMASDFATLLLLERSGLYDGAWWNEILDPFGLSAPRGVIFQTRLPEWVATRV